MAVDFETRLDSVLNKIVRGKPSQAVGSEIPEASELLVVAERLRALEHAPAPDLAPGKARFLEQAARLQTVPPTRSFRIPRLRLAIGLAMAAVMAIIIGNVLFVQIPTSTARNPTFTATPTRLSLAPSNSDQALLTLSRSDPVRLPSAAPVPVPDSSARPARNLISSSETMSGLSQCRS